MINKLKLDGFIEVQSGMYLNTQEHMIAEQKNWDESDQCKKMDFTKFPYWITDNGDMEPKGVNTIEYGILDIFDSSILYEFLDIEYPWGDFYDMPADRG